ncbi:iron complex outermembrane receptor protein [Caulobacter ginsengisoli]|uniref:Iron complex outermembrane receptor protein n=1 Tax=Caulobacter ginsengisoli TaxID=400775 RepID=A0ABU0IXN0_9CAUL|nr:TonB-dependent receptor [Caulobacter ginsengisoli]MDQ0466764.1 iron complex outermembrane receptor protein [Caulobacter ginsengisoli]
MVSAPETLADLRQLSIEDLANVDVSSVSKTAQPLSNAPAAIYVITRDDILRSGATTLPEILRLAPNLQVARITATSYAVSARGFNGSAADKLLVLIDGRSVYTPFSHGVFWDSQDVLPEDIDRIEVISGPGATLWGANAVNGVINILTRRSSETQGVSLRAGGGDREQFASLQYGGTLGDGLTYRIYADGMRQTGNETATGQDARDGWSRRQAGFRLDWSGADDLITLQGDVYKGSEEQATAPLFADLANSGGNLMARWTRTLSSGGTLQVQAYYDQIERSVPGRYRDTLRTYDLDVQHSFSLGGRHQIVWGGGYRLTEDDFPIAPSPPKTQFFDPVSSRQTLTNLFAQDAITLTPTLTLTLGLKLENEPYVGLEPLPNLRLAWKPTNTTLLWLGVSRAVRSPSRLDRDFVEVHGATVFLTGRDFQSESLVAYQLGYRGQPSARSSVSVSAYYNVYDDLRSFELTGGGLPIVFANRMEGEAYGIEAWGAYQMTDWWRLSGGFTWLHKDLRYRPGSANLVSTDIAGNDPDYQASVRSMMDLGSGVTLDLDVRRIGELPDPVSPAYTELGARVRWAVSDSVEIALTGVNLLNDRHLEFGSASANVQLGATGIESARSVSVDLRWRF